MEIYGDHCGLGFEFVRKLSSYSASEYFWLAMNAFFTNQDDIFSNCVAGFSYLEILPWFSSEFFRFQIWHQFGDADAFTCIGLRSVGIPA